MSFNKNGIVISNGFSNNLVNKFDTNYYIENDGSVWIRIFHHANANTKLFSSSDTFFTNVYKDKDRWFYVSLCNYLSQWEFLVKQKATSGSTEQKWRWIQKYNPMTASFNDVSVDKIVKNTSNEYSQTSWGGLHSDCNCARLCANNGYLYDWWGAIGSWNTHEGGIPAWDGIVVKDGFFDLYIRVDTYNSDTIRISSNNFIIANDFIEI